MRDRQRDTYVRMYVHARTYAHRLEISFHHEKKRGQLCRGRSGVNARRAVSFREQPTRSIRDSLSVSFLRLVVRRARERYTLTH